MSLSRIKLATITISLLLLVGCSGALLTGFRVGLRASTPFVATLVTEKVISQEKADKVVADLNDGIDAAVGCNRCLKAITATGNERKLAKAKCYTVLANDLRAILKRNNIGDVPQLDRIARIVDAGIQAFEEYARDVQGGNAVIGLTAAKNADPDKTLNKAIKKLKDDLRDATKSPGKSDSPIPQDDNFLLLR